MGGTRLCGAAPAHASLISDTVDCALTSDSAWACGPASGVVGSGPEFDLVLISLGTYFSVDLDAGSIRLDYNNTGSLQAGAGELLTLSGIAWLGMPAGEIAGIANFLTTAGSGISEDDVATGAHAVLIDLNQTFWQPGQFLSFDLVTRHTTAVPLPTSLHLLLGGFAGLALISLLTTSRPDYQTRP